MDAPLDLYRASREELIALVVRQREQIADLEQEQARLRTELATQRAALEQLQARVGSLLAVLDPAERDDPAGHPSTMPGLKPATRRPTAAPRPRRQRACGYGRRRMVPTARQVHALAACPHCGTRLRGGTRKRTREVIEWVPARGE